ncbi:iron-containing alcohol dehydrogenase [Tateyamaria pelophila]|uniref:iron-containing alcohol dehydrogenase n=1 Tax=Tateyamaria pelophila TaxID=328415 RepID=UPI001CBC5AF1|nr:iron-containing alcohol dehydrogenase [Tateyamaria pelophila]
MPHFSFSCPTRVHFGAGTCGKLASLLPADAKRVILVRGRSGHASAPVLMLLETAGLDVTQLSCDGEPTVASIDAALDILATIKADAVIACGGGAAIDTGKVVCFGVSNNLHGYDDFAKLTPGQMDTPCLIPCVALPTTAGTGAEVTANAVIGVPEKGAKISLRGRGLCPTVAIVDPDLMRGAPDAVVLHAGLDAVTQVFESFTSNAATPFSDALTQSVKDKGLPALKRALDDADMSALDDLAWISHVSGLALANSGLGAAHGLASVIGGRFDAPHGALCGRLLLPVVHQNLSRAPQGTEVHARLTSCVAHIATVFPETEKTDLLSGFRAWLDTQGLPRLADWSVSQDDLTSLATQGMTASSSQKNAVPLSEADYLHILSAAL